MQTAVQRSPDAYLPKTARPSPTRLAAPDAVDLLIAIHGAPTVALTGFRPATAARTLWTHPCVPFVQAAISPLDLVPTLQKASLQRRILLAAAVATLALAMFALGMVASLSKVSDTLSRTSAPAHQVAWSISRIDAGGAHLRTGAGANIFIPVGDRLPNGEVLVSVLPERSTVVLSGGTLVLRPTRDTSADGGRQ